MNYKRIYDQLMERGKDRCALNCYSEWHHIHPRSLGGGDEDSNLVELTYREHYLAHWLLTKIYKEGFGRCAMLYAFQLMGSSGRVTSSWQYDIAKKVYSDYWDAEWEAKAPERTKKRKKMIEGQRQRKANKRLADDPNGVIIIKGRHYRLKDLH